MQRLARCAVMLVLLSACTDATAPLAPTAVQPAFDRDDDRDDDERDRTECPAALPPGTYKAIVVPPDAVCLLSASKVKGNIYVRERAVLVSQENIVGGSIIASTDAGVLTTEDRIGEDLRGTKGSLLVSTLSIIRGDVRARRAFDVRILGGEVGGDVEILGGGAVDPGLPSLGFAILCDVVIHKGDVHITHWEGTGIEAGVSTEAGCGGNTLRRGSMSIESNVPGPAGLSVRDNKVARDIYVIRNRGPAPKGVQFNRAGGSIVCLKNDQPFVGTPNMARRTRGQCAGPRRPDDRPDDED